MPQGAGCEQADCQRKERKRRHKSPWGAFSSLLLKPQASPAPRTEARCVLPCESERFSSQECSPPTNLGPEGRYYFGKTWTCFLSPQQPSQHCLSSCADISLDTSLSTQQMGRFRGENLSLGFSEPVKELQYSVLSKIRS